MRKITYERMHLMGLRHTVADAYACVFDMGWLWLVGSIKLLVSFAEETYKRDNILQKRPII